MFEFTVAAMLEDMQKSTSMALPYIYTKYLETLFANNSVKKCSFTPKIILVLMF